VLLFPHSSDPPRAIHPWAGILLLAASACGGSPAARDIEAPARPFEKLSQYALFVGEAVAQVPAEVVIAYHLNSPLFSDYAEKYRFVKLPLGTHATYRHHRGAHHPGPLPAPPAERHRGRAAAPTVTGALRGEATR
jgi:hypothetical protein